MDSCSKKSIKKMHLSRFKGKTLVIDISIYLYKFIAENSLMESMYLFISVLKSYDITPVFVFDGKPPPEKMDMLYQRRMDKLEAQEKYYMLQKLLNDNSSEDKREELQLEMDSLKKQFIRIKDNEIQKVKALLQSYGITYYEAISEADQICAHLTNTDIAWACVSDDMDMLLYGCKRVLRHISLLNHTVICYDTSSILKDLKMDIASFRKIMVLSGTDYNIESNISLDVIIKWFQTYNGYLMDTPNEIKKMDFYEWIVKNTEAMNDKEKMLKICSMFSLDNVKGEFSQIKKIVSKPDMLKLREIMRPEGFVFIESQ